MLEEECERTRPVFSTGVVSQDETLLIDNDAADSVGAVVELHLPDLLARQQKRSRCYSLQPHNSEASVMARMLSSGVVLLARHPGQSTNR